MWEVGKLAPPGNGGETGKIGPKSFVWVVAMGDHPNDDPSGPLVWSLTSGEDPNEGSEWIGSRAPLSNQRRKSDCVFDLKAYASSKIGGYGEAMSPDLSIFVKAAPNLLAPAAAYVGGAALGIFGVVLQFKAGQTVANSQAGSPFVLGPRRVEPKCLAAPTAFCSSRQQTKVDGCRRRCSGQFRSVEWPAQEHQSVNCMG